MAAAVILSWVVLLIAAIVNGAVREAVVVPMMDPTRARAVSSFSLSASILVLAWFLVPWVGPSSPGQALAVGGGWLGLTLLFEFGFGHYVNKKPWPELLADYNVFRGRLWVLVLIVTFLSPWLIGNLRGLYHG